MFLEGSLPVSVNGDSRLSKQKGILNHSVTICKVPKVGTTENVRMEQTEPTLEGIWKETWSSSKQSTNETEMGI